MKYQKQGSNNNNKLSKKDVQRKQIALVVKMAEYNKLSLDELIELSNTNTVKGIYLSALLQVMYTKEIANLSDAKPI